MILLLVVQYQFIGQSKEYMLKAVFFEKFARFSKWPENTKMDTFSIKIIGKSPFEGALDTLYKTHKIKNKPVSIKYISSVDQINNCHLLFVTKSASDKINSILKQTESKPILTIGEKSYSQNKSSIINFYTTKEGTVHFEISYKQLKQCGIKMDPMLLDFAKIVN